MQNRVRGALTSVMAAGAYQLWQLSGTPGDCQVVLLEMGMEDIQRALVASHEHGPGVFVICNQKGNVLVIFIGATHDVAWSEALDAPAIRYDA